MTEKKPRAYEIGDLVLDTSANSSGVVWSYVSGADHVYLLRDVAGEGLWWMHEASGCILARWDDAIDG